MIALWFAVAAFGVEPTVAELLEATDDAARGEESVAVITMQVKTDRYERAMKMKAWSKGAERSLIRILEPAKDAGVSTLKVEDNLWNYLPKVDRTMKVPAGMMSGSWMGSHFSNDDLVRESRLSEDFTFEIAKRPADDGSRGNYHITCTPKPDAPVVWGKVVVEVEPRKVPVKVEYYDERGELVRTMTYSDVQEVDGRLSPMTMTLVPHDKPGEYTRMSFSELDFDAALDDAMFSLQALKQ
jgi:outer membrane lipoprotein-sorting protein